MAWRYLLPVLLAAWPLAAAAADPAGADRLGRVRRLAQRCAGRRTADPTRGCSAALCQSLGQQHARRRRPADGCPAQGAGGFTVAEFAHGLSNPRQIRVAPNGDIFVAESNSDRIRVLRAADGATTPAVNQIFADELDQPFGMAFYPRPGNGHGVAGTLLRSVWSA